jgi:aminomethyltransferase
LVGLHLDETVPLDAGIDLVVDGRVVGEITSATRSPTLKRKLGLGWLETAYAAPGSTVQAAIGDGYADVIVVKRPFLDAKRELMRA